MGEKTALRSPKGAKTPPSAADTGNVAFCRFGLRLSQYVMRDFSARLSDVVTGVSVNAIGALAASRTHGDRSQVLSSPRACWHPVR